MQNNQTTYTVSEFNQTVKSMLEAGLPSLLIEGEVSRFTAHTSGHWYFTLKDAKAAVDCVMFKSSNLRARFHPKQGDKVVVRARAGLYPTSGRFQLTVESIRESGEGDLQAAYAALKDKLKRQGLFDLKVKQSTPELPRSIAVVTSSTGAAIADVLKVLKRRYPIAPVTLYPTSVQGEDAALELNSALVQADCDEHDVLLLVRGGGSMEDLWAFNDEILANSIFDAKTPIISGIGHEIDTTIADLVADIRAPTPSAAAEIATPDIQNLMQQHDRQQTALVSILTSKLSQTKQTLQSQKLAIKPYHPQQKILLLRAKLDTAGAKIGRRLQSRVNYASQRLYALQSHLTQQSPTLRLQKAKHVQQQQLGSLKQTILRKLEQNQNDLSKSAQATHLVSPLNVLSRGYSVTHQNGKLISNSAQVNLGSQVEITLKHGKLTCDVIEKS